MVRVLVDEEITSKLPTTLVTQAAKLLQKQVNDDPKRARKHCEHIVEWNGTRIALICKYNAEDDIAFIIRARQVQKKKKLWR